MTDKQIKACKEYINTFRIPKELDFYEYFNLIKDAMKVKQKHYDKKLAKM